MKVKIVVTGLVLLILGIVTFLYAESIGNPNPFSPHMQKPWNLWHFFALGVISLSGSCFLVSYWLKRDND